MAHILFVHNHGKPCFLAILHFIQSSLCWVTTREAAPYEPEMRQEPIEGVMKRHSWLSARNSNKTGFSYDVGKFLSQEASPGNSLMTHEILLSARET